MSLMPWGVSCPFQGVALGMPCPLPPAWADFPRPPAAPPSRWSSSSPTVPAWYPSWLLLLTLFWWLTAPQPDGGSVYPLSSRPLFSQVWPSLHPPSYFLRPRTCASAPRSLLWSSSWPVLSSLNCNHTPLQHLLSVALGIWFACLRFFLLSSLDYTLLSSTVSHASETPALGTGPHSGLKCSVFIHQEKDNSRCVVDLYTL